MREAYRADKLSGPNYALFLDRVLVEDGQPQVYGTRGEALCAVGWRSDMNVWRYEAREQLEIDAPVERVYAIASDPEIVPVYAPEIIKIDVVKRLSDHMILVRSYLKVAWLTLGCLYRYHYRPPEYYSGVQVDGKLLRGYFSLTFKARGNHTIVSHTEGVLSPIPCLAWVVGLIYFQAIARGCLGKEMERLKHLVESHSV